MARDWSQHNPWHRALVDHCICIMASLFSHICVRRHTTNCLWTVWCQVTYYIMQQELLNSVQVGGCLPAPDAATHDLLAAAVTHDLLPSDSILSCTLTIMARSVILPSLRCLAVVRMDPVTMVTSLGLAG